MIERSRWVTQRRRRLHVAVERFVAEAKGTDPHAGEADRHRAEIEAVDRQVGALVAGLDPANLGMLNTQLTQMRTRKEFLQQQIRVLEASATHGDEATLRAFARERITLLDEAIKGKRDEKARAMLASFVNEIVIEPATKTGFMVLNAAALGMVPEASQGELGTVGTDDEHDTLAAVGGQPGEDATDANVGEPLANDASFDQPPPKPNNPSPLSCDKKDGSQVTAIAGARRGNNLRPRLATHRRFQWGRRKETSVDLPSQARFHTVSSTSDASSLKRGRTAPFDSWQRDRAVPRV